METTLGASKQANMQPLVIFTYQGRRKREREREKQRHNTDTYIPCTCSKPTEGVYAHVHETQVAESQSETYMPPDIQV